MEAVVLAGGFGTRLREVVPDLPKPMAPIAGRPFLEILLTALAQKGFTRVVLSLGYLSGKIINHFGNSFRGIELVYEVEEHPLGTGGAIRAALEHCQSDHAIVFNGDTYLDLEVDALEAAWQQHRQPIIVVREVPDTLRFGRIEVQQGRIAAFLEKGQAGPGYINAGCYVLPKHILDGFQIGRAFSIETDFFMQTLKENRFDGFVTHGKFIDIGVPADYELAQIELAGL